MGRSIDSDFLHTGDPDLPASCQLGQEDISVLNWDAHSSSEVIAGDGFLQWNESSGTKGVTII